MSHGSISVTSPNSSTVWFKDQSQTITWTATSVATTWNYFNIYLYDNTGLQATIATNLAGSIRSYSYTPPTSLDSAINYYILISGNYEDTGSP